MTGVWGSARIRKNSTETNQMTLFGSWAWSSLTLSIPATCVTIATEELCMRMRGQSLSESTSERENKCVYSLSIFPWFWEKFKKADSLNFTHTYTRLHTFKNTMVTQLTCVCLCVHAFLFVSACVHVCMCVFSRARARACVCVFVWCCSTINHKIILTDSGGNYGDETGQVCLTIATNSTTDFVLYRWDGPFVSWKWSWREKGPSFSHDSRGKERGGEETRENRAQSLSVVPYFSYLLFIHSLLYSLSSIPYLYYFVSPCPQCLSLA